MGNSKQCFSSRLSAQIVVVCTAINLERTRNFEAICLQKLQAVVITLLFNFLEEYIIVKRTLTTALISLRCTGNVRA